MINVNEIRDSILAAPAVVEQTAAFSEQLDSVRLTPPTIASQADVDSVTAEVRAKKDLLAAVEKFYQPYKEQAYRSHRGTIACEAAIIDPLKASILADERKIGSWMQEEATLRRQKAEKLQAANDAAFDKEIQKRAKQLEKAGKTDEARDLKQQAEYNRPVFTPPPVETPKGVVAPKVEWTYEITDPDAVPRAWCEPADRKIAATVKALGRNAEIPGVRIFTRDAKATVRR